MNWQFSACVGAFGFALVTVLALGGWMPGKGGSWPPMLAVSAAASALLGASMHLLAPREFWRKEK